VREFSRRSRTRMQQTLCAVPIAHVGRGLLFVTLTYPRAWPGDWRKWKRDLDVMLRRLARRFPAFGAIWKLEPQKRGAPHFHLLVVGIPFIGKVWMSRAWFEVVRSADPKHLAAGTQVQLARSHRGVVSYAAKYAAKRQQLPPDWQEGVGRWWGVAGRSNLGIVWCWVALTDGQYWAAVRVLRQLVTRRQRPTQRGPPRACHAGTWAVLQDWQALRVARCVLGTGRIGPPEEAHEYTPHRGSSGDCPGCTGQGARAAHRAPRAPSQSAP
jgi:hypothetical protein